MLIKQLLHQHFYFGLNGKNLFTKDYKKLWGSG
jgi:hypothetical protein